MMMGRRVTSISPANCQGFTSSFKPPAPANASPSLNPLKTSREVDKRTSESEGGKKKNVRESSTSNIGWINKDIREIGFFSQNRSWCSNMFQFYLYRCVFKRFDFYLVSGCVQIPKFGIRYLSLSCSAWKLVDPLVVTWIQLGNSKFPCLTRQVLGSHEALGCLGSQGIPRDRNESW